ncbi:MAG: UDP-N-acetylmuramoyl-L-alanyl-D-glutamate--2,6-diaminopimelate ligase [Verrucomicrobiales bacterium]
MTTLRQIVGALERPEVFGSLDTEMGGLAYDSRRVGPGSLFFALRGAESDGSLFIPAAVEAGAGAVVSEILPPAEHSVPWVRVGDARKALADAAAVFYGHPSKALKVAGVTGTNGKTTVGFLIQHLFEAALQPCGLLGTVRYDLGGEKPAKADRTTPESCDIQAMLAEMRANELRAAAMEVSSHGLPQHRVRGVQFDAAVFTNLTQDHLDYHGGMDAYFDAKALLFEQLADQVARGEKKPVGVINSDDAYGKKLLKRFDGRLPMLRYGMGMGADFQAGKPRYDFHGTQFPLEAKGRQFLVRLPLIGAFNVYNALAALVAANAMGLNLREAIQNLGRAPQVPGRLESVSGNRPFKVFVDYAHTPDALVNVLNALRALNPERLITVFGCGGNRDRAKRPLMGRAADSLSDFCLLTSDNPRKEDPQTILDDTAKGMRSGRFKAILDRREAIEVAIGLAQPGDIILIAGKGHEDYQEFADGRVPFDDRRVARAALR